MDCIVDKTKSGDNPFSAIEPAQFREESLLCRMRVRRRSQGRDVPREPLRQERAPGSSVDVRYGRVPERVEGVKPIESSLHLPFPERELDPAGGNACAALGAE